MLWAVDPAVVAKRDRSGRKLSLGAPPPGPDWEELASPIECVAASELCSWTRLCTCLNGRSSPASGGAWNIVDVPELRARQARVRRPCGTGFAGA
jgi:hypothetical protein